MEDRPPPLVCKTETPWEVRYNFKPKIVPTKKSPIIITLEDSDDDNNGNGSYNPGSASSSYNNFSEETSYQNDILSSPASPTPDDMSSEFQYHSEENLSDFNDEIYYDTNAGVVPGNNTCQKNSFNLEVEGQVNRGNVLFATSYYPSNFQIEKILDNNNGDKNPVSNACRNNSFNPAVEREGNREKLSLTTSYSKINFRPNLRGTFQHHDRNSVAILNTFCHSQAIVPEYEWLPIKFSNRKKIFEVRVRAGNLQALGKSVNRKYAKQIAADFLLKKINSSRCFQKPIGRCNERAAVSYDNPIGHLQEVCVHRKWSAPRYEETWEKVSLGGEFKIVCSLLNFEETGSGRTKKLAKREAALKMLEKLENLSPSEMENDSRKSFSNKQSKKEMVKNSEAQKNTETSKPKKKPNETAEPQKRTNESSETQEKAGQKTETQNKVDKNTELQKKDDKNGGLQKNTDQINVKISKMNELFGKDLYLCGKEGCDFAAETEVELKDHLSACNESNRSVLLTCPHCNVQRKIAHKYLQHLRFHGEKKFSCGVCNFSSGVKTRVSSHLKLRHNMWQMKTVWKESVPKSHYVLIPTEKRTIKTETITKEQLASPNERYKCCLTDCNFIAVDDISFIRHIKEDHADLTIPSDPLTEGVSASSQRTNGTRLRRLSNMINYKDIHQGRNIIVEDLLKREKKINGVKKKVDSPSQYKFKCELCGEFESYFRKNVHEHLAEVHSCRSNFACTVCNVKSNRPRDFIGHFAKNHKDESISYRRTISKIVLTEKTGGNQESAVDVSFARKRSAQEIPGEEEENSTKKLKRTDDAFLTL